MAPRESQYTGPAEEGTRGCHHLPQSFPQWGDNDLAGGSTLLHLLQRMYMTKRLDVNKKRRESLEQLLIQTESLLTTNSGINQPISI